VDDVLIVDEDEIKHAIRELARTEQMIVEGSGAVGIAALLARRAGVEHPRVAVVISGGNIDVDVLGGILAGG
jgi:threonine dehydratase